MPTVSSGHQRCYARSRGGCSTKVSLEHPLSRTVLESVAVDGVVEITGMAWQEPGEPRRFPLATLGCNVLCTEHNRRLSPFDEAGGRFMEALSNGLLDRGPISAQWFRGEQLERFMLKVLCGFTSGAMADAPGVERGWVPPHWWLAVLFGMAPLPQRLGMYFIGKVGEKADSGFSASVVANRIDGPYGLALTLAGLPLLLAMKLPPQIPPDSLLAGAAYRPAEVRYLGGGTTAKRTVELRWGAPGDRTVITYA